MTSSIKTATSKNNYVKVRLGFSTSQPTHLKSAMLASEYGVEPPYIENVCVLVPKNKVVDVFECFPPVLDTLCKTQVTPVDARLNFYEILEEDDSTVAYVIPLTRNPLIPTETSS